MASIQEFFANFMSAIMQMLGMKKSEEQQRDALLSGWEKQSRGLADEVESLKEDIKKTEDQIRAKSRELAATRGETRPIVEQEIKSLMREVDQKTRRQNVLFDGVDRMAALTARIKEIRTAVKGTVAPDVIRQLQADMSVLFMDLKDVNRETAKLDAMEYRRTSTEPQNYEARKAEAIGETNSATEPQSADQAVPSRLTEAEQQRLDRIIEEGN